MKCRQFLPAALAAVLLGAPAALSQGDPVWTRTGVFWTTAQPDSTEPVVDDARVIEQIAGGCQASMVRFGDTAAMRGYEVGQDWPKEVRNSVSSAALTDLALDAYQQLTSALSHPGLTRPQTGTLENRLILTALQFDDLPKARSLMAAFGSGEDLPGELRSDRLFWSAYTAFKTSSAKDWQGHYAPQLDQALRLDPSSFQVRFWRVAGWLSSQSWQDRSCADAMQGFSDMLLDMSDAGSCSLMVGHFTHALELELGATKAGRISKELTSWMRFTKGLLAIISQNPEVAETLAQDLTKDRTLCAPLMARELTRLGAL